MDFALSEEQQTIFEMAQGFGAEHIAPYALDWDEAGTIPKALWPKLAELGLGGVYVSEDHGGSGLSRLDATLVFEALAMACPSVGSLLSIHNMCAGMIDKFGSAEMKARLLPDLCSMTRLASYCLTEPGAGSDAAALKTRAVANPEGWRLTGTKAFISGGGYSDLYIVMARSGGDGPKGISAFVVENGAEGLSFGGLEKKMGWSAAHPPGAAGRMPDPARKSAGGRGQGLCLCHGRPRWRAAQHRGLGLGGRSGCADQDPHLYG